MDAFNRKRLFILFGIFILFVGCSTHQEDKTETEGSVAYRVFDFEKKLNLPGTPEQIYDAITGDISPWWDHTFSDKPDSLYIEAWPGGSFYERFDKKGNGVKHATVIFAERGKLLRMDGPLGLSGKAVQIVSTYKFAPVGEDSTQLLLEVHGSGELTKELPGIVEQVWEHFIFDRFKPYAEKQDFK